jgi:hypothetical protein
MKDARKGRWSCLAISALAAVLLFSQPALAQGDWFPPIGIPSPSFGIFEAAPAEPSPWESERGGFYYVCASCPNATADGNALGFPGSPRQSMPRTVPAGSVVFVAGRYDGDLTFQASGSQNEPVWIRGSTTNPALVTNQWSVVRSSYVVVEQIHFAAGAATVGRLNVYAGSHYIAVRHNEFSGNQNDAGGMVTEGTDGEVSDVVIYGNHLHDIGNINDTGDQDAHPIAVSTASVHVWVVDNTVTRYSGSGIIVAAGAQDTARTHHVFVGRNHVFGGKQTGIGVKEATDVIISENTLHDFHGSSSSGGACSISQYGPSRLWYIANTMFDCVQGIEQASTSGRGSGTELYIVGNLIYNIGGSCINLFRDAVDNRYVVGNTCVGAGMGVHFEGTDGMLAIENNIFSVVRTSQIVVEGNVPASAAGTSAHHNLFDGAFRVRWGGRTYDSLEAWQSSTPHGDVSLVADPLFASTDPTAVDLRPTAGSPAIDTGESDPAGVYTRFQALYGIDIRLDRNRGRRPTGAGWDVGAYEFDATSPPPVSILGLSILLNQAMFRAGNVMTLTAVVTPGQRRTVVDGYLVVRLPSGELWSWTGAALRPGIAPIVRNLTATAYRGVVAQLVVPPGVPPGQYAWLSALTTPSTLNLLTPITETPFTITP